MQSKSFHLPVPPEGGPVHPRLETAIRRARSRGKAVDRKLGERLGAALGYDFSSVSVHTGPEADEFSRQLGAIAFTIGSDVFFAHGAYDPATRRGCELIAHELIHVVQQSGGGVREGERLVVGPAGDAFEREADRLSGTVAELGQGPALAASSGLVATRGCAPHQIQRALATVAETAIPSIGIPLTCHAAVWCWAAQEAQSRGLTSRKTTKTTLENIVGLPKGPQQAMLALSRSGQWDFTITPTAPPAGTVLLWTESPTHTAIVLASGGIRGYNQKCVFPTATDFVMTTCTPDQIGADHKRCQTISETTIVTAAGRYGL